MLLAGSGAAALLLAGCGFRLRGPQALDFATLHVNTPAESELGAQLRRLIATTGTTRVEEDAERADARLQILSNNRGREILSLTGAGKVREYQMDIRPRPEQCRDWAVREGFRLMPPGILNLPPYHYGMTLGLI